MADIYRDVTPHKLALDLALTKLEAERKGRRAMADHPYHSLRIPKARPRRSTWAHDRFHEAWPHNETAKTFDVESAPAPRESDHCTTHNQTFGECWKMGHRLWMCLGPENTKAK
jgi:hypothetical protein